MTNREAPGRDRIAFLGHSTLLIELDGQALLTDPLLRSRVAHLRRYAPLLDAGAPGPVTAVLISHAHQDHLDLPSLRAVGSEKKLLVPDGAGAWLRRRGFTDVKELGVGDQALLGDVSVSAVPADHQGHRYPLGPRSASVGYLVSGRQTVYFAGDTGVFEEMEELAGSVDVALIPVSGWGSTLGPGHMGPLDAARSVQLVRPRVAVPIHWGTFRPIGPRPRALPRGEEPAREFARHVAALEPNTRVRVLAPGEEMEI